MIPTDVATIEFQVHFDNGISTQNCGRYSVQFTIPLTLDAALNHMMMVVEVVVQHAVDRHFTCATAA